MEPIDSAALLLQLPVTPVCLSVKKLNINSHSSLLILSVLADPLIHFYGPTSQPDGNYSPVRTTGVQALGYEL